MFGFIEWKQTIFIFFYKKLIPLLSVLLTIGINDAIH